MRRSIFFRLLGVTVLVAVCSIAATAWLAAQITRASLQQEQGRELNVDNDIYKTLLGYAVEHSDWSEVGFFVESLVEQYPNRRIALLTKDHTPIVDLGGDGTPLPATASAEVDALDVDPVLLPDAPVDRIDKRVLGPFRTPIGVREREDQSGSLKCLRATRLADVATRQKCVDIRLPADSVADFYALLALEDLVNPCLARRSLPPVQLDPDYTPARYQRIPDEPAVAECVKSSRQQQLAPYVAPAALLYVTSPAGTATTSFDLSSGNWWRVAGVAAAVLLVAIVVTAAVCARLIRPLRALTGAAHLMADGDATPRLTVRGRDEIAQLTKAFNTMVENRERMEEVRKAMVSDIAHELRTPLSNIRGWLEAAEDGLSERDPALIALLLKEALVLQHVVDDLQDLAAADAGKLRLNRSQVAVREVFAQLYAAHESRAAQNGITLTVSNPAELQVNADPMRLRQMLDNLVTNALRYVPSGGSVAVTARTERDEVVFEVADTGTGISPEDLPHVFDRFWRAEKSRNRQTGGSGLGLAIVRKLAEAHGGSATAESTPGQGATFRVRLPAMPRRA
jgi:two-component system sensor histidine kinase BaeS